MNDYSDLSEKTLTPLHFYTSTYLAHIYFQSNRVLNSVIGSPH